MNSIEAEKVNRIMQLKWLNGTTTDDTLNQFTFVMWPRHSSSFCAGIFRTILDFLLSRGSFIFRDNYSYSGINKIPVR